jgi:hypothetical protein
MLIPICVEGIIVIVGTHLVGISSEERMFCDCQIRKSRATFAHKCNFPQFLATLQRSA